MIYQKKTINNVPTKRPISNSVPVGNPVGTIISTYKKIQPRNYLYCDGSTFDETIYPALYLYLGSNVLPDYRECAMVGAEKNTTDVFDSTETDPSTGLPGTQNHDVYTQGEFKDDQLQDHTQKIESHDGYRYKPLQLSAAGTGSYTIGPTSDLSADNTVAKTITAGRHGTVTRGKRKAVYYYIKAVDGVDISDEDSFLNTVKNYVDDKNSYSTDEVPTGGVWIDGKPIYRAYIKTANFNPSSKIYVNIDVTSLNIEECINISGFIYRTKTGYKGTYPLNCYETPTLYVLTKYENSSNNLSMITQIDDCTNTYAIIFLEYTKTTD